MEKDYDLGLLGNVKTFVTGLLSGAIVFSLFVPRFVNHLHEILGWPFIACYWVFVFLYFIMPVLALIVWFEINIPWQNLFLKQTIIEKVAEPRDLFYDNQTTLTTNFFDTIKNKVRAIVHRRRFVIIYLLFLAVIAFSIAEILSASVLVLLLTTVAAIVICIIFLPSRKNFFKVNKAINLQFITLFLIGAIAYASFIYKEDLGSLEPKDEAPGLTHSILQKHSLYLNLQNTIYNNLPAVHDSLQADLFALNAERNMGMHDSASGHDSINELIHFPNFTKQKAHFDALYNVGQYFDESDAAGQSLPENVLTKQQLIDLTKADTSDSAVYNSIPAKREFLNKQVLLSKIFIDYSILILKKWDDYMKENWKALIRNLQIKGLIWLFILYFLTLCLLYKKTIALNKLRKDSLNKAYASKKNEQSFKPNRRFLTIMQLRQLQQNEPDYKILQLSAATNALRNFIIVLAILILPFYSQIDNNNIDLQKPFLNYDAGKLTGLQMLQSESGSALRNLAVDSSVTIIINSFNSQAPAGVHANEPIQQQSPKQLVPPVQPTGPPVTMDSVSVKELINKVNILDKKSNVLLQKAFQRNTREVKAILDSINKKQ